MRLYLLRHAVAVERGTPGYENDADRPLTPKGRRKMEKVAEALKEGGLEIDQIVSSPYVRTRETAHVVAKLFKLKVAHSDFLVPGSDCFGLKKSLSETYPQAVNMMLVGHEPDLSELTCLLIGAPSYALAGYKKGGMACLNLPSWESMASLEYLVTPRMILRA